MGKVFKSVDEIQFDGVRFIDARFDLQDREAGKKHLKKDMQLVLFILI